MALGEVDYYVHDKLDRPLVVTGGEVPGRSPSCGRCPTTGTIPI